VSLSAGFMRPIFQICRWEEGWIFPQELPEREHASTGFAIAWHSGILMEPAIYAMPGEMNGAPTLFPFVASERGLLFQHPDIAVRLAPDPTIVEMSPWGLPYVGTAFGVISAHRKGDFWGFMPLIPDNLDAIDRLYLEHRIIFVGVTAGDFLKSPRRS
jgi:hypothetical protein